MSANSSSSSSVENICYTTTIGVYSFIALFCFYVLFLLPIAVFVLHLGLRRRRRRTRRPVSTAAATAAVTSNLDLFTYNIIAMKMLAILGLCTYIAAYCFGLVEVILSLVDFIFSLSLGETWFHVLTCGERYLAVVHPITYLSVRSARGVRIRNLSIFSAWFLTLSHLVFILSYRDFPATLYFFHLVFAVVVTSFCSLSVLRNLIGTGPGEVGGAGEQGKQVKKRAFYTILVITGVLTMRLAGSLIYVLASDREGVDPRTQCVLLICGIWATLPSSYVLPMLFLHRAGKLPCFKYNT